jgi:hypothetical protein
LTDAIMSAVRDELAGIRGLPAPTVFAARPPASVRKVSMPPVSMPPVSMPPVSMPPGDVPAPDAPQVEGER